MADIGWDKPDVIINKDSAKFLHKVIKTKNPEYLFKIIKLPRIRQTADISIIFKTFWSHLGPSVNDLGPFGNLLGPFGRHLVPFGSHTS